MVEVNLSTHIEVDHEVEMHHRVGNVVMVKLSLRAKTSSNDNHILSHPRKQSRRLPFSGSTSSTPDAHSGQNHVDGHLNLAFQESLKQPPTGVGSMQP